MSESKPDWRPVVGERVVLVATGQTGTVLKLAPTEWGLLCNVELDPHSGAPPGALGPRRVYASIELRPLAE
ncbi:MAG: hypothetical protein U0893_04725 [Chloroflexota bacterium]